MTTDPELTAALRAFLDEGADRMPERVHQAAMDAVPSVRRRRTWSSGLELRPVAAILRFAPAAALVLVAGLATLSLLSTGNGGVIGSAPTPTATLAPTSTPASPPTPTPLPSGGALNGLPVDTVLGAGTYEVGAPFGFPFTITLPEGTRLGELEAGRASFGTTDGSIEAFVPEAVFPDPCAVGEPVAVSSADDLVAALTSMVGFTATTPQSANVAGHPARTFVLTNTIDTVTAGCTRGLMLPMFSYHGNADAAATNGGIRQVVWVVDVDGRPLLIVGDGWGDADRPGLESLIGTIELR